MEWLNYHHLHYFWLTAREGGVTRAAKKLRLAQPTLSGQIRQLEAALGGKLFDRRGRNLVLTALGQTVYQHADAIFALGRGLLDAVAGAPSGRPARLVVGSVDVLPKLVVYRLLEPALRLAEPARIVCREGNLERLLAELSTQTLDLVLSDCPTAPLVGVKAFNHLLGESGTTFFATAELCKLLRRKFPASLDGAPFLMPGEESVMRRALDVWLEGEGIRPDVVAELEDRALVNAFGQAGVGVFIGPSAIEHEIIEQHGVQVLGRVPALKERFYAISLERRIRHPGVLAISAAARELLAV